MEQGNNGSFKLRATPCASHVTWLSQATHHNTVVSSPDPAPCHEKKKGLIHYERSKKWMGGGAKWYFVQMWGGGKGMCVTACHLEGSGGHAPPGILDTRMINFQAISGFLTWLRLREGRAANLQFAFCVSWQCFYVFCSVFFLRTIEFPAQYVNFWSLCAAHVRACIHIIM